MGDFWAPTQEILQGADPMVRKPKVRARARSPPRVAFETAPSDLVVLTFHAPARPSLVPRLTVPPHPHTALPSSQLTENLLKKPPFRFLHDVVSEVIRNTGYARGLFDDRESDSANIKDKETKVAWLDKIIACVSLSLDEHVPARPLKIVAGLEPERTNDFLQALGRAARRGDGAAAVRRVLAGDAPVKPAAASAPAASYATPPAPDPEPAPAPPPVAATFEPPVAASPPPPSRPAARSDPPAAPDLNAPLEPESPVAASTATARARAPARPVSARRAPPKLASKVTEVDARDSAANAAANAAKASGGGSAPTGAAVMGEGDDGLSDDDDDDDIDDGAGIAAGSNPWAAAEDPEGGGALVRDMLAAKREGDAAARGVAGDSEDAGGGSSRRTTGIILGGRRHKKAAAAAAAAADAAMPSRGSADDDGVGGGLGADAFADVGEAPGARGGAASRADLATIREHVQALVQSTNPLGKAMDALQEDMESMRKELAHWQRERQQHARRIEEDRNATAASAAKDERAEEIDAEVAAMRVKISGVKAAIAKNDAKIAKLLAMVVTPA